MTTTQDEIELVNQFHTQVCDDCGTILDNYDDNETLCNSCAKDLGACSSGINQQPTQQHPKTMTTEKKNHAIDNAKGWMGTIMDAVAELKQAQENDDSRDREDSIREEMMEMPLSVSVREGWKAPGSESELAEYEILLSTGGPALRIWGELGRYNEPANARLEWQDWGTPWTEHTTTAEEDEALLAFASLFYFGE